MTVAYFTAPDSRAILVVYAYQDWIQQVMDQGFPPHPVLLREATTTEAQAHQILSDRFPAWLYRNADALIDDEIKSGADRGHLASLVSLTMQVRQHDEHILQEAS